jgi:hypothetical protein
MPPAAADWFGMSDGIPPQFDQIAAAPEIAEEIDGGPVMPIDATELPENPLPLTHCASIDCSGIAVAANSNSRHLAVIAHLHAV